MKIILMMLMGLHMLYADALPTMAFLAYDDEQWVVCLTQTDGSVKEVILEEEPHTFDYNFQTGQILYTGSYGKLRIHHKGSERELKLPYQNSAYTQPDFSCQKELAYAVELIEGNSKSTHIVLIDLKNDALTTVIQQNSSQFEPSEIDNRTLLFTSLTCNQGCGKLMQEIWQKNSVTGESDQLTLLNAFSNNPTAHFNDQWIFFSSNKNGNYHIWGKNPKTDARAEELTFGNSTDTFPGAISKGSFVYIHHDKTNYRIMHADIRGKSYEVKLSKQYKKIRQLKVNTCD